MTHLSQSYPDRLTQNFSPKNIPFLLHSPPATMEAQKGTVPIEGSILGLTKGILGVKTIAHIHPTYSK